MKILVVDDDLAVLNVVCLSLQRAGHTAIAASGAKEACVLLENDGPFELVLTDMRMPGGSGLEVLRVCVRRAAPQPAMLVMTGEAGRLEIDDAMALGVQSVIKKPFRVRELLEAVSLAVRPQPIATAA